MEEMLLISAVAGLTTVLGALVVFIFGTPSRHMLALFLGFAGGVMLAIACLELMQEALILGGNVRAAIGFLWGVALLWGADSLASLGKAPTCPAGICPEQQMMLRAGYLVFFGIAIHNLAEGLAIGAGHIASPQLGLAIAIGIGLHNIPEGIAMALPFRLGGMRRLRIMLLLAAAGLVTAVGAAIGYVAFSANPGLVSGALGFAAGAMFFIVIDELIPRARSYQPMWASLGLVSGFLVGVLI